MLNLYTGRYARFDMRYDIHFDYRLNETGSNCQEFSLSKTTKFNMPFGCARRIQFTMSFIVNICVYGGQLEHN